MKILITGGTGFIGQHLVAAMACDSSHVVTLLLREAYSHTDLSPLPAALAAIRPQFEVVYADLRNFQLTARAVRQAEPDCVIHLAAAGVTDPFVGIDTALRHNLSGTINLIRACFEKTNSTRQLIIGRTPGEHSNMNVYAASKAAAWNFCEMYARTQRWPIHGAMIFQAYGPSQSAQNLIPAAIAAAVAGQDFPMTAGTQQRDWIYIEDVVNGLRQMVGKSLLPAATVELGTGELASVADVVRQIYALVDGVGRPLIGALPFRVGEEAVQCADVVAARMLVGWQMAVSLQDGLRRTIFP